MDFLVIVYRSKTGQGVLGVLNGVDGIFLFALVFFVPVFCVAFLDVGGILKHDTTEIAGGVGTIDDSLESVFYKGGDGSAMVDMCVREN